VKPSTLDQRLFTGEAAFALGCHKPAHTGEYFVLDAVAMILASMLNRFAGLQLKEAADIVCSTWNDWLTLLIRAESFPHVEQFVCVARTSLDRSEPAHIAMGEAADIAKVCPPSETAPCLIPMQLLLRCLRGNAAKAGIDLPERLTVDPDDKPAYAKWRDEIDAYREAAGARVAKAKLAPA
jgi:hypothetical protein